MDWFARPCAFFTQLTKSLRFDAVAQDNRQPLDPRFEEIAVFYNFVFDLAGFVNPTEAARSLLKEEFALSTANYLNNDIEVAERFKDLAQLRADTRHLAEMYDRLESAGLSGTMGWVVRHPRSTWQLWRQLWRAYFSAQEEEVEEEVERDLQSILTDTTDFLDEAMTRIQVFEALQRHIDRTLFTPQYLQDIPFTRIGLQPFFATIGGVRMDIDVGVLIHRTGVAILTFYAFFDVEKTVDELISLQLATQLPVESMEVVRAIVEPGAAALGLRPSDVSQGADSSDYSSGVEWLTYNNQQGITLSDVFELYQVAIISAIQGKLPSKPTEPWSWLRTPDWFAYPIVFVRHITPEIPNDSVFKARYARELAALLLRFSQWRTLKTENITEIIKPDYSLTEDHSLYVGSSHSLVLYYEPWERRLQVEYGQDIPGQEWLSAHFQTSTLIDALLVQRWALTVISSQLYNLPHSLEKLNALKRSLLVALEEYHDVTLTYGSANDIVRQAQKTMGIGEAYEAITQKLTNVERLIAAEESRRHTQRDLLLKVGAIFATLLFGLTSAWQVVEVITEWSSLIATRRGISPFSNLIVTAIEIVQADPIAAAVTLYLVLVITVVTIIIWSFLPARNRYPVINVDQSRPAYTPGFTWPVSVEISNKKEQENGQQE